jgi:hypothetical protein
MAITDEQIGRLLQWFATSSETNRLWGNGRKRILGDNQKWIQPSVIHAMTDDELETKFLEYYRTGGGRQALNQIYRDRIIRDKGRFRKTLSYLLDEGTTIQKRVDQVLGGEYRLEGFGKAILTSFLMDYHPDKYCLWNNKTDMGFSVLGWRVYESRDSKGTAYLKVLDALNNLIGLRPDLKLSFIDVDLFLHTISAEDEGRKAVRIVTEGEVPVSMPSAEQAAQIPTAEGMEFIMEKYLEDFIEANFNKIDFGAKLELYQDEESTGRQYPTSIGNIDLLAVDRQKNEFVVIELKKGRISDVVVGQILRYMGWVKANLAKDTGVRGIVISKEKDEKLEYALKSLPNVSLFLYTISFDLRRA